MRCELPFPVLEPDKAFIEHLLLSITAEDEHPKIQEAIDQRLRAMSYDELVTARDFFRYEKGLADQAAKYDRIIREISK